MSDRYNFNTKGQFGHYEVQVDTAAGYGYFEHDELGDERGGGLWFQSKEGFVIQGIEDGEPVYWIHNFGWGADKKRATVYDEPLQPRLIGETGRESVTVVELIDYDGVAVLPKRVAKGLVELGFYLDPELFVEELA